MRIHQYSRGFPHGWQQNRSTRNIWFCQTEAPPTKNLIIQENTTKSTEKPWFRIRIVQNGFCSVVAFSRARTQQEAYNWETWWLISAIVPLSLSCHVYRLGLARFILVGYSIHLSTITFVEPMSCPVPGWQPISPERCIDVGYDRYNSLRVQRTSFLRISHIHDAVIGRKLGSYNKPDLRPSRLTLTNRPVVSRQAASIGQTFMATAWPRLDRVCSCCPDLFFFCVDTWELSYINSVSHKKSTVFHCRQCYKSR